MPSTTHVSELKVLRRNEPSLKEDENDWPQFDVRDVEVRDGTGALCSLFAASPANPVSLTGTLITKSEPDRVLPAYKTQSRIPISVQPITYFAFGIFHGGGFAIWAAGEAGWHNVQPAKTYQKAYNSMVEGLSLLYYLVECHENGKKVSSDDVFKQYGKAQGIPPQAAAERFYSHAPFLASRMAKNEEGIRWGHTSFYQHLRRLKPEAFGLKAPVASPLPRTAAASQSRAPSSQIKTAPARSTRAVREAIKPIVGPPRMVATRSAAREAPSSTQSTDARLKKVTRSTEPPPVRTVAAQHSTKKFGRPRNESRPAVPRAPLLSELNKSKARDVWKFMQKKSNDTLPEIAEMTVEIFARFLHEEYEFVDEKEAQYFLKYLAPDLVGMMSVNRNRSYDPWTELPIYDELLVAKVPPRVKFSIAALQLKKRDAPLPGLQDDTENSDEESSEESIIDKDEAKRRKREAGRRRISMMRPKSASKYSRKAAKRKGKEKAVTLKEDEEMIDADGDAGAGAEEDHDDDNGDDNGDENGDDNDIPVASPLKRKSMSSSEEDDDGDEDEPPEYPNKRFTRSRGDVDPELEDLEFEARQARSMNLPVRRKASQPSLLTTDGYASDEGHIMTLVSEPDPSTEANAPGDTWNCPYTGCLHKVYGASESASKELIREHLVDHKDKDRVRLVRGEESMTRLPVSHLLKRIREMAERSGGEQLRQLEGGMMGLFPAPLERKVF